MAEQRDPWEVYSAAPSAIQGPPKVADPVDPVNAERNNIALERDRIALAKDQKPSEGKPLSDGAATRYESDVGIYGGFKGALGGFRDDYAGNTVIGRAENWAQSLNSDIGTPGQREWWSNVDKIDTQVRNQLFGASLTPGESGAYDRLTVSPSMDPKIVRENLAARAEIIRKALNRRTNFFRANGFRGEAVDALAGEYAPDFRDDYKPAAAPASAAKPEGEIDLAINTPTEAKAGYTPQQEQALSAFFAAAPNATPDQINGFAASIGLPAIQNAQELSDYYRKGGRGFGGVQELTPAAVTEAAKETLGDTTYGTAAGIVDAVPFAPQIGAVADTLGLSPGRPSVFDSDQSFSDLYAFNRDANNEALKMGQQQAPISYALGQAGGIIAGGAGLARALPAAGALGEWAASGSLPAQIAKAAPLEAAYGAAYGAGRNPNDQVGGALRNAGAAALGGAVGRGVVGALGRAVAPTGGKLSALYEAGVRPTPGQRFANQGYLGATLNGAEEALQSFPGLGYAVKGAREGARDQFERGAFNRALGEINDQLPAEVELGTAPHAYMQEAFKKGYDETLPRMTAVVDDEFTAGTQAIRDDVANGGLSDESARRFDKIISAEVDRRLVDGTLSGEALKSAVSNIGKRVRDIRSSAQGDRELAASLENYLDEVKAAASRHSDPQDVERLAQLDRGYAMGVRIEDAAKARGGDPGRFSPTQFDRAVQSNAGGVRSRAYLRGDALMQDYAEAGKTLVDRLPNSGTADRLLMTQGAMTAPLGALGYASPAGALGAAAVTAPYLPGVRRVTQGLIAPRKSARLNTLGDLLRRNAPLGGAALGGPAAPLLLPNGANNAP